VDRAWGYFETDNATTKVKQERHYRRTYVWDVRNRLTESHDSTNDVYYIYGEDGIRTNKYTREAETIYFNNFWTWHKDGSSELDGGKNSKHIFLGTERLVTKVNSAKGGSYSEESGSQYFYHSDHLGSAQLVTNHKGEVYQRIEYTPYGETWIDMRTNITALYDVPYRFTAKELDSETGLYYYGARYLDPKYSRWISTDPALGDYIPAAGKANAKDMANLPGMGGIFNHINADLYHYAGNNPVRYIDPDGRNTLDDYAYQLRTCGDYSNADKFESMAANASNSSLDLRDMKFSVLEENLYYDNTWKDWWNKPDGAPLTDAEAELQRNIAIGEMVVGPIAGTAVSAIDPAGFLAGMYVMADGAIVFTAAQEKVKKTPVVSIPTTFLLPFVQVDGIVFPAGGPFIW